jgi:predicted ribosomally synthesized peptide with SipW-like signal peptide
MRSKIAFSFVIMALVCALVGGSTFAYFTSTANNAGNTFSAGTVVIGAGAQTVTIPVNGMAPGDTISGSFVVSNNGTLGEYFKVVANTVDSAKPLFTGTNHAIVTVDHSANWELLASGTDVVNYSVTLPGAARNEFQGAAGTLSFTVNAQQAANNSTPVDLGSY